MKSYDAERASYIDIEVEAYLLDHHALLGGASSSIRYARMAGCFHALPSPGQRR